MADIRAFKAIRPRKDLACKIAALPYDVLSSSEAKVKVSNNKYSFLHIDKAEIDLNEGIDKSSKEVYEKAKDNLNDMISNGEFIKDNTDNLYVYRQIHNDKTQTGIVFCASIDDYINNIIKKHEFTREDKEKDRINHIKYCNANTGPIFLTYKHNKSLDNLILDITKKESEYDFIDEDNIRNIVWVIDNEKIINEIIGIFKNIKSLYIADGHHRAASAVKVGIMKRKENRNYTGYEDFNYFLAVAISNKDVNIIDYNRVIKDLNGYSNEEFIDKLKPFFCIEYLEDKDFYKPIKKHEFGMNLDGKWFKLIAKEDIINDNDSIEKLDVFILQKYILENILDIKDIRTSNRIDFIGGIRGMKELNKRVNEGMKIAFALYPTDMNEIIDVADDNRIMPPKSTWFEPKLRSGLFIHEI